MATTQRGFPSSHPQHEFTSIPSAWASPASTASPLARGPCLQCPNLLLVQALTACKGAAEPCPRADSLSPATSFPFDTQIGVSPLTPGTSSILESERGIRARCEDAGVRASLSLPLQLEGNIASRRVNAVKPSGRQK